MSFRVSWVFRYNDRDNSLSIWEDREFIEYPACYKCPIENILLKLWTKANYNVKHELLLIVVIADVSLRLTCSNTLLAIRCFLSVI